MHELIFQDSMGNSRVIANCKNYDDAMKCINAFIRTCKRNFPNLRLYYYAFMWKEQNMTQIDIGTYNAHFYIIPPLEENEC